MRKISSDKIQEFEIEHIEKLRILAPECMVLLKKNGDFPLETAGEVALYGTGARNTIKGGTGSGDVNVRHYTNIEEGLEKAGFIIKTKKWLDAYDEVKSVNLEKFYDDIISEAKKQGKPAFLLGFGKTPPEPAYHFPIEEECDVCIYVLSRISGEGSDRKNEKGDFMLSDEEVRDILLCQKKYKKFLLVLNVGGVLDLSPIINETENIILLSQLGTVTGDAFADVLLGKSYPSGKLTTTWAPINDYITTEHFGQIDDTEYSEGIYVGYRYFEKANKRPMFPFGYGLSYTEFDTKPNQIYLADNRLTLHAIVSNIGKYNGKEIVKLYYSSPNVKTDKPLRELGAYIKSIELKPSEKQQVSLILPIENMASWDSVNHNWVLEEGDYYIYLNDEVVAKINIDNTVITTESKTVGGECDFTDLKLENSRQDNHTDIQVFNISVNQLSDINHFGSKTKEKEAIDLGSFTDEELAKVCVGKFNELQGVAAIVGNASYRVAGAAGESSDVIYKKGYGKLVMADGPAGLRITTSYIEKKTGALGLEFGSMEPLLRFFDEPIRLLFEAKQKAALLEAKRKTKYYHYACAIPVGTALAQSWNDELVKQCGDMVGEEMELFGINVWLAPAMNIHRNPLCGRNFEYYSEDPLLSGKMASAMTLGVQSHKKCAVTIKHFCCNNQETNRFGSNSIVSERALREIYLKPFEICIKEAEPLCVMSSYNLLNGVHTANRKDLNIDVLRDEWGFNGLVITDWGTTSSGFNHDKYGPSIPYKCISSGNDLIMSGNKNDVDNILQSLQNGELSRKELECCANRVLLMAKKLS